MKNNGKILALCLGGLALSGCTAVDYALDKTFTPLQIEAGNELDEGAFGNPSLNNQIAQSAYIDQNGLLVDLNTKFQKDVPTTINFDFNSASLDPAAKDVLASQANWIRQFPEIRFRVYGHTDLVGADGYNRQLGLRRAQAAVNFMVAQGVNRDNLEAMVTLGETDPLVVTEERERQNRRTVTEVAGFARNFVGSGLDGKYAALVYKVYTTGGPVLKTGVSTTGTE